MSTDAALAPSIQTRKAWTRADVPKTTYTSLPRVFRSEWIKLRTLRSTWIMLAAVVVMLVGIGLIAAATTTGAVSGPEGSNGPAGDSDPVSTVLTGANLAVLLVAVLGVLVGAREYVSGQIRTSLAAVPARLPVLWGKVAALAAVLVPATLAGTVLAYFGGMELLEAGGEVTVSWSDQGVSRAVLATAGYLVGIGLIGFALGMLLRSTAGGIGVVVGGVLILPSIAGALLPDSWADLLNYLPSQAGQAFTTRITENDGLLGPAVGAAVFVGWIVLALAAAAITLKRRDA
jgi:ABC-2 type transport system permease protein